MIVANYSQNRVQLSISPSNLGASSLGTFRLDVPDPVTEELVVGVVELFTARRRLLAFLQQSKC